MINVGLPLASGLTTYDASNRQLTKSRSITAMTLHDERPVTPSVRLVWPRDLPMKFPRSQYSPKQSNSRWAAHFGGRTRRAKSVRSGLHFRTLLAKNRHKRFAVL